ncbi:MAG: HNH endonuclease [Proteobacteria bacterium]|nr:HNH endonuclease [Pseudomonadota bacterium]
MKLIEKIPGIAYEDVTVGDLLYWSYANLAMAHAAVGEGRIQYARLDYIIRAKLFKGLRTGTMKIGSLLDDERFKLVQPRACVYCGSDQCLSMDHLVPKCKGGPDDADNIVWACRRCNSAKGDKDMLFWYRIRGCFPPLMLLRRYLKLAIRTAFSADGHKQKVLDPNCALPPFVLSEVPLSFPDPGALSLH